MLCVRVFGASAAVAIVVVLALLVAGQVSRGHPLLPALHFSLPGRHEVTGLLQSHRRLPLNLPGSTATLGSRLDIAGKLPGWQGRLVILSGSLNDGPWRTLDTGRIDRGGRFTVAFRYYHRGHLDLRLNYPNGDRAVGSVTVK